MGWKMQKGAGILTIVMHLRRKKILEFQQGFKFDTNRFKIKTAEGRSIASSNQRS